MGNYLSEPKRGKHSSTGDSDHFSYGATAMQGWRITMEDAHVCMPSNAQDAGFFAVFDGHCGDSAAKYCGEHLHDLLIEQPAYKNKQYEAAIKATYLQADEELKVYPPFFQEPSGCTAVSVLITPDDETVYCGNAGDSRCILSANGIAHALSFDHKPNLEKEKTRILAAGGYISCGRLPRVNGDLALSRAIGDFEYKKGLMPAEQQMVTSDPEIISKKLEVTDEFIVLACDGIWDVLSSQNVVDFVRDQIVARVPLHSICEQLCDRCISPTHPDDGDQLGFDNMTVIIVALLQGKTKEEWYDQVSQRTKEQNNK